MIKAIKSNAFVVAVAAIIAVTVIICVCAASCGGKKLDFCTTYYYVCYRIADNSVSASSLSGTVESYGGAGYILHYNGNYYVTVSCYYTKNDADTVCSGLKKRELNCSVLEAETPDFAVKGANSSKNVQLYKGNLDTLNSLSLLAYECANKLDTGEYTQSKAKDVTTAIKNSLNGLLKSNSGNCFTTVLRLLIADCEDKQTGFLYSRDMRYLQIALTSAVINAELY